VPWSGAQNIVIARIIDVSKAGCLLKLLENLLLCATIKLIANSLDVLHDTDSIDTRGIYLGCYHPNNLTNGINKWATRISRVDSCVSNDEPIT
jgi:hypothetical protein